MHWIIMKGNREEKTANTQDCWRRPQDLHRRARGVWKNARVHCPRGARSHKISRAVFFEWRHHHVWGHPTINNRVLVVWQLRVWYHQYDATLVYLLCLQTDELFRTILQLDGQGRIGDLYEHPSTKMERFFSSMLVFVVQNQIFGGWLSFSRRSRVVRK